MTLDLAIDAGGDGPPGLPDEPRGGKLPPFKTPFEPLDMGGEASWPRLELGLGEYGESVSRVWYLDMPDHSLPWTETGDKGPFRPFMVYY